MDKKLKAVRVGHKGMVTKLFRKFDEIQEKTEVTYNEVSTLLDAVTQKKEILVDLNGKILEQTAEEDVLEEMEDSDEYMYNLELKLREIRTLAQTCQNLSVPASAPAPSSAASDSTTLNPHANIYVPPIVQPTITPSASLNAPSYVHNQPSMSLSSTRSDYHKLPKLNLPTFEGDILNWQSFWDSYESAIHTNPSLGDVQKFNYLKSLMNAEALQTIAGLSMTNANYAKAISLLQERYGQVHKIIQTYMQSLLDMPAPVFTLFSLRSYYDKMESYVRGLESLGQAEDSYGELLVPVILNKLPAEVRQNLAREHRSTNWTLDALRRAILDEVNILEAGKVTTKFEILPATAAFLANTKPKANRSYPNHSNDKRTHVKSCNLCREQGHLAMNCTKFATAEARLSVVKKNKLCFNCLGRHKIAECKSTSNCRKCKKRHHTSICTEKDDKPTAEESSKPQTEISDSNAVSLHSSLTQHNSNVLLKTAVANVSSGKQISEANILLDEGAQRSFITESLAGKLGLNTTGTEVVHLSGFGEQNRQVRHLKTAVIYLHTDQGDSIPLNVLVIPEIAVPIQTHIKSVSNMQHLRGLKLAHPVSENEMFEINLLIGADYYWTIVGDRIIRGNGPTAVESKIGFLLSGPTMSTTNTWSKNSMLNVMVAHKTDEANLAKFWEIESGGVENERVNQNMTNSKMSTRALL